MSSAKRVGIALPLILLVACGAGDAGPEEAASADDRLPVTRWLHEGTTYPVVSGVAVPGYWDPEVEKVKEALGGQAVRVYLSDQRIDCALHPFLYRMRIPPLPTEKGATITLNFHKMATPDSIYTHFHSETAEYDVTTQVCGSAEFIGPNNAKRVEGWLEYEEGDPESPKIEVSGAFDVPFCPADIISFAPGTDIEKAAGTVEAVKGLEPYQDPETFEMKYRDIPKVDLFVIVPEANNSVILVPLDDPKLLLEESRLAEEFARDGLRVIFSGTTDERPFQYADLNRIPIRIKSIESVDSP